MIDDLKDIAYIFISLSLYIHYITNSSFEDDYNIDYIYIYIDLSSEIDYIFIDSSTNVHYIFIDLILDINYIFINSSLNIEDTDEVKLHIGLLMVFGLVVVLKFLSWH